MGKKRTFALVEHSSNERYTTTKKKRNGPIPIAKNLEEYLQMAGCKDQNDNHETKTDKDVHVISVRSKGKREHVEEVDADEEVSLPGSSFDSSSDGSPKSNAEKAPPSKSNALPSKSKRPMSVEIVGSSSSDHDSSMEISPRTRTRSSLRSSNSRSNYSSRASDSLSAVNGADSMLENPFPTPPSSDSNSSCGSSSGDSDPSPGPSSRSRCSTTTVTTEPARASPSLETSSSSSASVSNNTLNLKEQKEESFKKPAKPASRTIVMTPSLREHFRKYSKLKLRVELTCFDDDGEIPGRPELEPRPGEPGAPAKVKPEPEEGGASASAARNIAPPVCRHQGERHLIILPSLIHGRGLFTTNSIKTGEMIIEYAGEVVSSKLALQRQNWYIQRQINNYVMHIDKELHIDATNEGNCSRYINHSCEPNCTAEVLTIRGVKRVLIIALKDIQGGQELTYDYRFTSDELVPCYCSTPSCRLFLNHNIASLKLKPTEIKSILKAHREG